MAIERELLELYRDPALAEKPALLERRGGAYYSEAAAKLIASLHDGTGDVRWSTCGTLVRIGNTRTPRWSRFRPSSTAMGRADAARAARAGARGLVEHAPCL